MPKIINLSRSEVVEGLHSIFGGDAVLIQICDPDKEHVKPKKWFSKTFQFEFFDCDKDDDTIADEYKISSYQAAEINILECALDSDMHVVVQCTAGLCRSGSVVEVGCMMGFDDPNRPRVPNVDVKHALLDQLGAFQFSEDEE